MTTNEYPLALSEVEQERYRLMAHGAMALERDLWTAAGVVPGAAVADVGCGPGAVSAVLAGLVGPEGRVMAVDQDPSAVAAATEEARLAGLANVSVSQGSADATGLEPGSVDVVMIRHVLAHNGGREAAIVGHAAGLVRPGGCVYLVDIDITAFRVVPRDPDVEDLEQRYREWHARKGNDLSVGLRLRDLLAEAGLESVDHHGRYQIIAMPTGMRPPSWAARDALVAAGLADAADVAGWEAAFERVDKADPRPTVFAPLFMAYGRRPG